VTSIDVGGRLWRYAYDAPHVPYCDPVMTPAGHVLSRDAPPTHPWHHGLWFAIKFVNGDNFWEELDDFGVIRYTDPPRVDGHSLVGALAWIRPDGETPPSTPKRVSWKSARPRKARPLLGGADGDAPAGLAILDAPTNPNHPVPWYGHTSGAVYGEEGQSNFCNAAFLWDGPRSLAPGETLAFDYRVIVHDGVWSSDQLAAAYDAWTARASS
jgi:Family of unknown function (DUF6807)